MKMNIFYLVQRQLRFIFHGVCFSIFTNGGREADNIM